MVGAIIGAAAQIGSSIYGAVKSSQANKKTEEMIRNKKEDNQRWYDQKMEEDYSQRSDAQNVLRKQRELLNEQYQRARATNVVSGGTDETLALQQEAANKTMADTMGNIAAQASDYKEGVEAQYRDQDSKIQDKLIDVQAQKGQAIAQAASQVGSAVGGLIQGGVTEAKTKPVAPAALELDPDAVANEVLADEEINKYNA